MNLRAYEPDKILPKITALFGQPTEDDKWSLIWKLSNRKLFLHRTYYFGFKRFHITHSDLKEKDVQSIWTGSRYEEFMANLLEVITCPLSQDITIKLTTQGGAYLLDTARCVKPIPSSLQDLALGVIKGEMLPEQLLDRLKEEGILQ